MGIAEKSEKVAENGDVEMHDHESAVNLA